MYDKNGTRLKKGDAIIYGSYLDEGVYLGFFWGWQRQGGRYYRVRWMKIQGDGFTTQRLGSGQILKR